MWNSLRRLHVHCPRRRALDLLMVKRQPNLVRIFDHVKAGTDSNSDSNGLGEIQDTC